MSKPVSSIRIGSFIIGAMALAVISIIVFSKEKLFIDKDRYVVYFKGSVNGLKIGAPVKLKGVQIGIVDDIQIQFDVNSKKVLTPAYIDIETSLIESLNGAGHNYDIKELINLGLRAQLTLFNVVTGNFYIEVDFLPDTPINLVGADPKYPEIPVVPSSTEQIQSSVTKLASDIQDLPIREMFNSLLKIAKLIEQLMASPELVDSTASLARTLRRVESLVAKIESRVDPLASQTQTVMTDLSGLSKTLNQQSKLLTAGTTETLVAARKAAEQLNITLTTLENMANPGSPLYNQIALSLSEMSAAARSIKVMADTFQQHPEALIYGKHRTAND